MPFCQQCGKSMESDNHFCTNCGNRNEYTNNDSTLTQNSTTTSPTGAVHVYTEKHSGSKSNKGLFIGLIALLGVVVIGLGVFLVMKNGDLNDARATISTLESETASLEGQLLAEQVNVATLNGQLAEERAKVASLQNDLTATESDLSAAQARVNALETEAP